MADGINLGKAYVQIIPSAEGIQGKLSDVINDEAESAGKSGGGRLSSALGGALKTGIGMAAGAAATGAAAVGKFASAAVSSFGEYEQLVGGVEKLYGDAAGQLQDFAKEAYKTSGLSANAYMETATSFSASLISSLGGDTKKAAELTDVAMRAMSDNANVFGSDMQSVQSAFQGFAKQNYTMLDNLKLGYGGTKSEMERLIADANEYRASIGETADLSIDSYADIIQAIQSVQEAQGIAGTTNKEAMATLEGSAAAVSAAWENVITSIGSGEGLQESIDALISSVFGEGGEGGLLSNILPAVETAINGIGDFIGTAAPIIVEKLPPLIEQIIPPLLEAGITLVSALGDALMQSLPILVPIAFEAIMQIVNALLESLPAILQCGLEIISQLALGIAEALPELVPTVVDVVLQLVDTLVNNIDMVINAGIALLTGLATGLINALPTLIEKAPIIIEKLITGIVNNLPKIAKAALDIIVELAKGIVTNLPQILESGVKILGSLIEGIGSMLSSLGSIVADIVGVIFDGIGNLGSAALEWGADLISGFIDGIGSMAGALWDTVCDIGAGIVDFLGFSEPDKGPLSNFHTFAPDMMKLFAEGVEQNIGLVTGSVEDASEQIADALSGDLSNAAINVAANISPVDLEGVDAQGMAARKGQQGTDLASLIALLSEYLPMLANGVVNVTLEGDAEGIFNVVRSQNKIYKRMNGASAFA